MSAELKEQASQEWDYYVDMPVGEILRRARLHYGLSLSQVEAALCIRSSYLEALESGNLTVLPGRTYAIGFIRTYAEYLRLDGDKIVHLFKIQSVGNGTKPELNYPSPASESKLPNRYILFGSTGAFALLLFFLSISGLFSQNNPAAIPSVPEEMKFHVAGTISSLNLPLEAVVLNAIEPAVGGEELAQDMVINIKESAWLEVRNKDGKALISQVLSPGDSYILPDEAGLVLDTGNAGALEIMWGDVALPPLGESGDIIRNVSLELESLQKLENMAENAENNLEEETAE